MTDEPGKHIISSIADCVPIKEAYEDVAQPVARQTGQALEQVGALVNSALRPVRSLQLSWNALFDRLDQWLVARLSGTPTEQIVEPAPNLTGSVVAGLLYVQDEEVLRDMFVQLLATGMTERGARIAHPAFAECIKQMTALDARLVRALARYGDIATLILRAYDKGDGEAPPTRIEPGMSPEFFSSLLEHPPTGGWVAEFRLTAFDVPDQAPPTRDVAIGLDNLERLGLIRSSTDITFADPLRYYRIATCSRARSLYDKIAELDAVPGLAGGTINVSNFGRQFMRACLRRPAKGDSGRPS